MIADDVAVPLLLHRVEGGLSSAPDWSLVLRLSLSGLANIVAPCRLLQFVDGEPSCPRDADRARADEPLHVDVPAVSSPRCATAPMSRCSNPPAQQGVSANGGGPPELRERKDAHTVGANRPPPKPLGASLMLKCGGAFYASVMAEKQALSWGQQVDLLAARGLLVADPAACVATMRTDNYYRLSGYMRYFQRAPEVGDNTFVDGADWSQIRAVYDLDAELRAALRSLLGQAEILLRSTYAYVLAHQGHAYRDYLDGSFYSGASTSESIEALVLRDIGRSRDAHVVRYRRENDNFDELPIWSAVEALSFGTLSRGIERGIQGQAGRLVAEELGLAHAGFSTQVKALVYLRNRCAHHARLWNHSVIDAPSIPTNQRRKAQKEHGKLAPRSVATVLVALERLLSVRSLAATESQSTWALIGRSPVFKAGVVDPQPTQSAWSDR